MKKTLFLLVTMLMFSLGSHAQADKIIGVYKTVRNGVNSKVRVTKKGNAYQAQVIWVDNLHNPDGTIKRDDKNPDASKRNTPADQIILIESVTYNDGKWEKRTHLRSYQGQDIQGRTRLQVPHLTPRPRLLRPLQRKHVLDQDRIDL